MAVFRVNKNTNYTVMSNYHFKDKNLSLKAKGLLSQMLSLPADWDYTVAGLCAINKENSTAIKSALNELKEGGYLKVTKLMPNQTESGHIEYIYDIYEKPTNNEKQGVENQGIENLYVENHTQLNTNKLSTKKQNTNNTNTKVLEQAPEQFGNSDINEIFDAWEKECGFKITSKVRLNRFACQRLLKSRGKESIIKSLPYVAESQADRYAPNIVNIMDLEEKWNALAVWYKKKYVSDFNKNGIIKV